MAEKTSSASDGTDRARPQVTTIPEPASGRSRGPVAARWFALGVAASLLAAAAFLLHQLTGVAAARGRDARALRRPAAARRAVRDRARGARRRAAPLPARVGGRAPRIRARGAARSLARRCSRWRACRSSRSCRAARGPRAGLVATLLVSASWVFLFHGVYGRMYSLFLFTSALSYLALLRALDRGGRRAWALWGSRSWRPWRRTRTARSCSRRRGLRRRSRGGSGCARRSWAFGAVAVLGMPFWLTDLVLADRFDVGAAAERGARWPVVRVPLGGCRGLHRRLAGAAGGARARRGGRGASSRARRASSPCARRRPARRCSPSPRQLDLAGDEAPDLRPAVLRARRRRGCRAARPVGSRRARLSSSLAQVGWAWDGRRSSSSGSRTSARRPGREAACRSSRDEPSRRRALRLRAALPRRLGANPTPVHRPAARRREAGALDRSAASGRSAAASGSSTRTRRTTRRARCTS